MMPNDGSDNVNHPPHYTAHPSGVECIEVTEHMIFNLGNAIKYIWRCDEKGDPIENIDKAIWYLKREKKRRRAGPRRAACDDLNYFHGSNEIKLPDRLPDHLIDGFVRGFDLGKDEIVSVIETEPEPEAAEAAERPEPEPPTEQPADPPAELVSGPFSEEEAKLIVDLTLQGEGPTAIAKRLNRAVKDISNWKFRYKERIARAVRKDPEEPDAAPEAKPAAPKTSKKMPRIKASPKPLSAPARGPVMHIPEGVALRDALSGPERAIYDHLGKLLDTDRAGWTADRDCTLVQMMLAGEGPGAVAAELGSDKKLVLNRWRALNTQPVNLSHGKALLKVLMLRAEEK